MATRYVTLKEKIEKKKSEFAHFQMHVIKCKNITDLQISEEIGTKEMRKEIDQLVEGRLVLW